jgi:flavodoxin
VVTVSIGGDVMLDRRVGRRLADTSLRAAATFASGATAGSAPRIGDVETSRRRSMIDGGRQAGNALIVYVSVSHGNTARIARAMGEALNAERLEPELVDPASLGGYDVVGFGSGIFAGTPHPRLRGFIEHLPPVAGTPAFTFTTSGFGRSQSRPWEASLEDVLRSKGYVVVGSFACRGFDTWLPLRLVGGVNKGHPDAADLARAHAFARHVADEVLSLRGCIL